MRAAAGRPRHGAGGDYQSGNSILEGNRYRCGRHSIVGGAGSTYGEGGVDSAFRVAVAVLFGRIFSRCLGAWIAGLRRSCAIAAAIPTLVYRFFRDLLLSRTVLLCAVRGA